jgi:DNA mismatch endonuclease (patch repair protein)
MDGWFWHRCPEHATAPKNNASWWAAKLEANVVRDRRQDRELVDGGWTVVRVWEHEVVGEACDRIEARWRALLGEPPRA